MWTGVLIGAALLFVACTFKPVVQGDGVAYFAYLHSIVVDRDLDMSDEYAAAAAAHISVWPELVTARAATGLLANYLPVGPALLSLPAYLLALVFRPSGEPQFGPPFTSAYVLASLVFGLFALALSYRLARQVTGSARAALIGVTATALTTPFFYYLLYEPSYSHTFSAFMVSAFVSLWWTGRDNRTTTGWMLLGLLGGLMALTRYQDGLFMAVTLLDVPKERWRLLLMVPGTVLGFAPQLWVDRVIFASWLPVRPAWEGVHPLTGHYLEVLFSSFHGLFTWSPVLLAALAGYVFVRNRTLRIAFLLCLVLQVLINGANPVWWGGFSFGARRFINLTPFFAIGLAALATRLRAVAASAAMAVLLAWNLLLLANFSYVIRSDIDPGYGGLVAGQWHAIAFVPHLFVQGYVVRALAVWPLLHQSPNVAGGVALLGAEALGLLTAFWVAGARTYGRS